VIVKVLKKHLKMGHPSLNKCPLSLAFQEKFGFTSKYDTRLVQVSRKCLTLLNYNGLYVYTVKLPPIAEQFNDAYWKHYEDASKFSKLPKPCEFEIGVVDGYDVLHKVIFDIKNWHGDMEYEYPS